MKVREIAKLIRLPKERWKHAMKRARKIKRYGPTFEPKKWNTDKNKQYPHNCYTYFLNKTKKSLTKKCKQTRCRKKNNLKPQPGYYAGYPKNKKYTCRNVSRRVLKDNPNIYKTTIKKGCRPKYYMGALAVMPNETYHFYRRDKTGLWSHKPGGNPATQKDASGNYIINPRKANRKYTRRLKNGKILNYSDYCGEYCIPVDKRKKHWRSGIRTKKKRKKLKKRRTRHHRGAGQTFSRRKNKRPSQRPHMRLPPQTVLSADGRAVLRSLPRAASNSAPLSEEQPFATKTSPHGGQESYMYEKWGDNATLRGKKRAEAAQSNLHLSPTERNREITERKQQEVRRAVDTFKTPNKLSGILR